MGKPSAPEPPDYAAAAKQQGEANLNSALATNYLNQVNQVGPYGTLTYSYEPNGHQLPDGTWIPNTTVTTELSPEQQQLLSQNNQISVNLNDLALGGLDFVKKAVENPPTQQGSVQYAPTPGSLQTTLPSSNIQTSVGNAGATSAGVSPRPVTSDLGNVGSITTGLGSAPQVQTDLPSSGGVKTALDQVSIPITSSVQPTAYGQSTQLPDAGPLTTSIANTAGSLSNIPGVNTNFNYTGPTPTTSYNIPTGNVNAQYAQAPNINLSPYQTGLADAGAIQGNVGNTSYNASGVGPINTSYDFSGVSPAPKLEDFAPQRDQVTAALMQRLQPYLDREQSALDTRLANQGINLGSEAYSTAQNIAATNRNDQRIAALLAGSQEQQRLFENALALHQGGISEAVAQGNFGLQAQGQGFGQNLATAQQDFTQRQIALQLANAAQAQKFGQTQAAGQFNNDAIARANAEALTKGGYDLQTSLANAQLGTGASTSTAGNNIQAAIAAATLGQSGQNQAYNQALNSFQVGNAAQGQAFDQGLANANLAFSQALTNAQLGNTAQGQKFSQGLQEAQFSQQVLEQRFNQDLASGQFGNQARSQIFSELLNSGVFTNSAQAQVFAQALSSGQFQNAGQAQIFAQMLAGGQFANDAQAMQFAQVLSAGQFKNSAEAQLFGQMLASGQFQNQTQQQIYTQLLLSGQFANAADAQRFSQALTSAQFFNATESQQFGEALASSQFNNQARSQSIQEADYYANQPLNLLNALRSGNQVTLPQFSNANTGVQVQAAPIYQATADQYDAALQAYKAKMSGYSGLLGGLGDIGAAAVPYII